MKMKKYIAVMCAASMLAACSDWDDHYDANPADTGKVSTTLWQEIQATPELSEFAGLVEKAGCVDLLSGSQTYTVWAPVNGSLDLEAMQNWDNDRLTKELVENHMARNSYLAAGIFSKDVRLYNNKVKTFEGSGNYSFGGFPLSDINKPCLNGVLHTLSGQLSFLPNIYESLNNETFPIDSISNYMHSFDVIEIDVEKSTKGPVENGEITYLDTVKIESNYLFDAYHSRINREDSAYTMIVPTNEAWNKAKAAVEKYFNYIPTFTYRENTCSDKTVYSDVEVTIDAQHMRDSLIYKSLMRDLFYNNRLYSNKLLQNYTGAELTENDSLCSTGRTTIYGEDINRLLENAQYVEKSNGGIFVVDSLRMQPWTSWCPPLHLEAFKAKANILDGSDVKVLVPSIYNYGLTRDDYMEIMPASSTANPEISFYLDDVRSTTYAVYLVVVPNLFAETEDDLLPNRMRAYIGYNDETGRLREKRLGPANFTNDPMKVDTLYIDDITFPVCYAETNRAPYFRLESYVTASTSATHDRTLRIDQVILIPKELDDYMKEHPDYKPGLDEKNSYVYRY